MFWTSPTVNAQINEMLGYDLVILQYGLNILEPGIRSFAKYGEQIEKMIAYIRQCFPTAAVLVMSVSDRSVKSDSGFVPMDSAPYMAAAQRQAAQNSGAAFWSAYDAMQSLGGKMCIRDKSLCRASAMPCSAPQRMKRTAAPCHRPPSSMVTSRLK